MRPWCSGSEYTRVDDRIVAGVYRELLFRDEELGVTHTGTVRSARPCIVKTSIVDGKLSHTMAEFQRENSSKSCGYILCTTALRATTTFQS